MIMDKQLVYLDYAAATPVSDEVLEAMHPFLAEQFYNPSALYLAAKEVHRQLESARESVAGILGARPSEIVFTAGGTEANNLAIRGVMEQFPDGNVVVSAVEHDSVLRPAAQYDHHIAPVTPQGRVDVDQLMGLIDDQTVLVSIMYANNETGAVQPITTVAKHIQAIRDQRVKAGNTTPLYLHTDACQAANYLPLSHARLGVDLMTLNGGKIYGPKQTGCLYIKAATQIAPQVLGGGQERGMRSGTENVSGFLGLAQALDKTARLRETEYKRLQELQTMFIAGLLRRFPDAVIQSTQPVLPNFVHIQIPGADNERLIMELDERGVMAAAGSACSASSDEPSHVLKAMGLSDEQAQSSIRFTMGRLTTREDIDTVIKALAAIDPMLYTASS